LIHTLDNGLTVVLKPTHAAQVVALQFWVRAGSADESETEAGLAHFHEHMLFKGTENRGVGEIARDIEGVGGNINAWTSFDQTVYHITAPSDYYKESLEILADAVCHSTFDAQEMENEAEVILEEIKQGLDSPGQQCSQKLFSLAFSEHPYHRPIIGYEKTVKGFNRDDMLAFYQKWYVPNNAVLVLAGDFDDQAAIEQVQALFGPMEQKPVERARTPEPPQEALRFELAQGDTQESHIRIGMPIPGLRDEDLYALDMLALILGQGDSCRFDRVIQRQKQVVNYIGSHAYSPIDQGLFLISATLAPGQEEAALDAIFEEIAKIQHQPPSRQEVEKARTLIESDAVYQRETVQGLAKTVGFYQAVAGDLSFEEKFYRGIAKVTPKDIQEVAKKYLQPQRSSVVLMTPETKDAPALDKQKVEELFNAAIQVQQDAPKRLESVAQQFTLSNGIRVILKENTHAPVFSIRTALEGGLRFENDENNGIGHIIARLLSQGTPFHSAEEIAYKTDRMAGTIAGFSGRNSIGLQGDFLSRNLEEGLKLFFECLLHPTFPEKEIALQKRLIQQELLAMEDHSASISFKQFSKTIFPDHPYRYSIQGTKENVASFTQEQLQSFYKSLLHPKNLVISIVGDINSVEILQYIEAIMGHLQGDDFTSPTFDPVVAPTDIQVATKYKEKEQAHLVMGFLGTTMYHPDRFPMEVLSSILSGQGGRLFVRLRDQMSLAYSISPFSLELIDTGYFAVYIGTSPNKIEQATEGILSELQRIREEPVPTEELERTKRYLLGSYAISLQRNSSQAFSYALNELYGLGYNYLADYPKKLKEVTAEQVQDVARRYLTLDRYTLSIVQPKEAESA